LTDEEPSEPAREEEEEAKELRQDEPETLGTAQNIEVSTITPHVLSTTLSNESNLSYQST